MINKVWNNEFSVNTSTCSYGVNSGITILVAIFVFFFHYGIPAQQILNAGPLQFKLIEIDTKFKAEACDMADLDNDGDMDIVIGDYWFENTSQDITVFDAGWEMHELRAPKSSNGDLDINRYSETHGLWVGDYNGDGFKDVLNLPYHNGYPTWMKNPGLAGIKSRWEETRLSQDYRYGNEQSWYTDFVGQGTPQLLTGNTTYSRLSFWSCDGKGTWSEHSVSADNAPKTGPNDHGLGLGDIDGDGLADVIQDNGWYKQPVDAMNHTGAWEHNSLSFMSGPIPGFGPSHLHTYDINKDGRMDVVTSSSHSYGVWWFEQKGLNSWAEHEIDNEYSSSHALFWEDMDGDGNPDLVAGKRFKGHSTDLDPAPLYWIKYTPPTQPGGTPTFNRYMIKLEDAGLGVSATVKDFSGDGCKDIAVSNKKGTRLYIQQSCGCMDTSYVEYDATAISNGNCLTQKVSGCMDKGFLEYNPVANVNTPGACITSGLAPFYQGLPLNTHLDIHARSMMVNQSEKHSLEIFDLKGNRMFSAQAKGKFVYDFNTYISPGIYTIHLKVGERLYISTNPLL
ncbi:MAG: VCBS repeat-containing protein [Fibrobacteria bacterium]|nr:VCBS repeat-containing protein [Fibrobacteria bacterium]